MGTSFSSCLKTQFPKSLFFPICLPCSSYISVSSLVPVILNCIGCLLILSLIFIKFLLNENFITHNFFIGAGFMLFYPIVWIFLMSAVFKMRQNFLINMFKKNNKPVPDNILNLKYIDILKQCSMAGIGIFVISFISLLAYTVITQSLNLIRDSPLPPPFNIIVTVIDIAKGILDNFLTPNGVRILLIMLGTGIQVIINLIPLIGPLLGLILFFIPPNILVSQIAFTSICPKLGLDDYQFDQSPFTNNHFKEQVLLGLNIT